MLATMTVNDLITKAEDAGVPNCFLCKSLKRRPEHIVCASGLAPFGRGVYDHQLRDTHYAQATFNGRTCPKYDSLMP